MPNNGSLPKLGSTPLIPDNLVNIKVADNTTKLIETANIIKYTPKSIGNGLSSLVPSEFAAITNSSFSNSMQNGLNSLGNTFTSAFESTSSGGFGALELSNMISGMGGEATAGGSSFFVKLEAIATGELIVFNVMPIISEQGQAVYDEVQMPHHPGAIVKYNHTAARAWSISSIKLISRTIEEADANLRIINLLRAWKMPYYGDGTAAAFPDKLGAPPEVLNFSAYGSVIDTVPVVLESASWSWPNDVDYIHTSSGDPFPVILNIDLQVKESWSPSEFSGFNLAAYKAGNMKEAYQRSSVASSISINPSAISPLGTVVPGINEPVIGDALGSEMAGKTTQALSFSDKAYNVASNIGHGIYNVGENLVSGVANDVTRNAGGIAGGVYGIGRGIYNTAGVMSSKLQKLTEPYNGK